jgi:allophanate hydrolase subunit 2
MLEVIKPGLETSVQDYPGRIGYWNQGFPRRDRWTAGRSGWPNVLVGKQPGAAALECQFVGPTLKFQRDGVIAVTGADMQPKVDEQPIAMWQSVAVRAGRARAFPRRRLEALGQERPHRLSPRGTGLDLHRQGLNKSPEHGAEPSNIIDQRYPLGAINLAGQTPIILVNDGPSMGGFINPYTVPLCAFWKLGQSEPGEIYRFRAVTVDEAQAISSRIRDLCNEDSIA